MIRFHLFRINLELHYSFFLLLLLVMLSGNIGYAAFTAIFSFLHELVHRQTAIMLGYTPEKISFGLFGGVLHIKEGFLKPQKELLIHLSGPFFNLLIAMIFYVGFDFFHPWWVLPIIQANLLLGLFNLMPFYPLDGGKIIDLYLAFFLGYSRSEKISKLFSLLFSLFLFFFGIYLVQYNVFNAFLSLLAVNLYIAGKQNNSFIFYKVSRNIEAADIGNRKKMVVCREDAKAIRVIERYKPLESNVFTVVNEKGHYKGQLSERELLNGIYHCGIYAELSRLLDYKRK